MKETIFTKPLGTMFQMDTGPNELIGEPSGTMLIICILLVEPHTLIVGLNQNTLDVLEI